MSFLGRRGFLKLLGMGSLGAAATAAMPAQFWASPEPLIGLPEFVEPAFVRHEPLSLAWMTSEVAKQMSDRLRGQYVLYDQGTRLGDGPLKKQFACTFAEDLWQTKEDRISPEQFRKWQLEPVGAVLADRVNREGWGHFGALPLPSTVQEAVVATGPSGISVRGLRDYNALVDRFRYRFDIIGG